MLDNWIHVSKDNPCPICGHRDWCILSADGSACICYRIESDRLAKSGNGWIHRLGEKVKVKVRGEGEGEQWMRNSFVHLGPSPSPSTRVPAARPDIAAYFAALPRDRDDLQGRMCRYLERQLGLPAEVMIRMDWRYDPQARAAAIPMRAADGTVCGIRYRDVRSGKKWAKRGTKDGLFFDPAAIPEKTDELVVCEGPTDCVAVVGAGAWCVGRSSCGTGRDLIREFMRLHHVLRVTIFADADEPKTRPDGTKWNPGVDGALRLGPQLRCPYRVVFPPIGCKDLRDWQRSGTLNRDSLKSAMLGAGWSLP